MSIFHVRCETGVYRWLLLIECDNVWCLWSPLITDHRLSFTFSEFSTFVVCRSSFLINFPFCLIYVIEVCTIAFIINNNNRRSVLFVRDKCCAFQKREKNIWTLTGAGTLAFVTHAHTRLHSEEYDFMIPSQSYVSVFALFFSLLRSFQRCAKIMLQVQIRYVDSFDLNTRYCHVFWCTHVHRWYEAWNTNISISFGLSMVGPKKGKKKTLELIIIGIHEWNSLFTNIPIITCLNANFFFFFGLKRISCNPSGSVAVIIIDWVIVAFD